MPRQTPRKSKKKNTSAKNANFSETSQNLFGKFLSVVVFSRSCALGLLVGLRRRRRLRRRWTGSARVEERLRARPVDGIAGKKGRRNGRQLIPRVRSAPLQRQLPSERRRRLRAVEHLDAMPARLQRQNLRVATAAEELVRRPAALRASFAPFLRVLKPVLQNKTNEHHPTACISSI